MSAALTESKLKELRAQWGAVRALKCADGAVFALRRFTPQEALAFVEKRTAAQTQGEAEIADYSDDGTRELLGALVWPQKEDGSPDKAALLDYLEKWPRFTHRLGRLARELGGDNLEIEEDQSLLTEELLTAHGRLIGLRVGGRPAVMRRLTLSRFRFLEREQPGRVPWAALAAAAREHLVLPGKQEAEALFHELPFLPLNLGALLWSAASVRAEEFEGK